MEILSFPPRQQMEVVAGGEYKTFTEGVGQEAGGTSGAGCPNWCKSHPTIILLTAPVYLVTFKINKVINI